MPNDKSKTIILKKPSGISGKYEVRAFTEDGTRMDLSIIAKQFDEK